MLSMLAEDMISPKIGITVESDGHPIQARIPVFNAYFWFGSITDWSNSSLAVSYASAYTFGAFLARNFGGAAFVRDLFQNDSVNEDSIIAALNASGNSGAVGMTFGDLLARFSRSLVTNAAEGDSLNKEVSGASVGLPGYDFAPIDIYSEELAITAAMKQNLETSVERLSLSDYVSGPVFSINSTSGLLPHSMNIIKFQAATEEKTYSVPFTYWDKSPVTFRWFGKTVDGTVSEK
jgi:hypothetical protein